MRDDLTLVERGIAWLAYARKTAVYVVTAATALLAAGVLVDPWQRYALGFVAIAGAVGIFASPRNAPHPPIPSLRRRRARAARATMRTARKR